MKFKVYKIMPVIIFFVPLQSLTNNGIMTVDTVSYGTVPFGTLFAGYIERNAMVSPSGCCHTLPEKKNILAKSLKKCAEYFVVWKIRINTHTHTHTHTFSRAYFTNYSLIVNTLRKRFLVFPVRFPVPFHRQHLTQYIPPSLLMGRTTVPYGDLCSMNTMPQVAVAHS